MVHIVEQNECITMSSKPIGIFIFVEKVLSLKLKIKNSVNIDFFNASFEYKRTASTAL